MPINNIFKGKKTWIIQTNFGKIAHNLAEIMNILQSAKESDNIGFSLWNMAKTLFSSYIFIKSYWYGCHGNKYGPKNV